MAMKGTDAEERLNQAVQKIDEIYIFFALHLRNTLLCMSNRYLEVL